MNQCFHYFFIGFIIVVHLVTIKKFDICLLTGWSSTLFILLVNIFDHTFNLFINNIVRKPIIDESLFYVFYLFIKSLATGTIYRITFKSKRHNLQRKGVLTQ